MIIRRLPPIGQPPSRHPIGTFADHTLFTEKIGRRYESPEHIAGAGILCMLSGHGEYGVNGKKESLDRHSFLVINHGSRLSMCFREKDAQPLMLFFRTGLITATAAVNDPSIPAPPSPPPAIDLSWLERVHPQREAFRDRLEWLANLDNCCSSFCALKADGLISGILEQLTQQVMLANRLSIRLAVARRSTRIDLYKRLSMTREWITDNYSAPITLQDMGKKAALNEQHFLRMFRECFGMTPHRFLVQTRLGAARKMLLESGEKISAICRSTGFESLSSFSGLFRQQFGRTPTAFRRQGPGQMEDRHDLSMP
ncbi:MAG TPA: AraC family transcriptional regulator [Puia sp.]|nr:AraC family transcriptional regulator [Puia sp.]